MTNSSSFSQGANIPPLSHFLASNGFVFCPASLQKVIIFISCLICPPPYAAFPFFLWKSILHLSNRDSPSEIHHKYPHGYSDLHLFLYAWMLAVVTGSFTVPRYRIRLPAIRCKRKGIIFLFMLFSFHRFFCDTIQVIFLNIFENSNISSTIRNLS